MIVAVASGKGGTGKTTVTASLTTVWDEALLAVDLDVEEPNLHLFLQPSIDGSATAHMPVPVVDERRCTHCGACSDLCQFKAISVIGELILTFPEMCHGCGGCIAVCPEQALSPGQRVLGEITWGEAGKAGFLMGRLRIGEAMSPPLMRLVKVKLERMIAAKGADAIIDAPPGVSCPAVNAVIDSDVIVLVTEPTPFGFHDF
jgi:MinD superfamily P-loop ATPase